jgi:hypothetical protein
LELTNDSSLLGGDQGGNNQGPDWQGQGGYPEYQTTEPTPDYQTPVPGSPGTAIGVYPPNIIRPEQYPQNPNYQISVPQFPFFFLPQPAPQQQPCNCGENSQHQPQPTQQAPTYQPHPSQQQQQHFGYLGFIPILFVPPSQCNNQNGQQSYNFNFPFLNQPCPGCQLQGKSLETIFSQNDGLKFFVPKRQRMRRLKAKKKIILDDDYPSN